ncbi:nucleic acid-binding protein consists of a PIN domain and a Zn-ribbon module [Pyrenophora tritici-repentis]|nr:nucleic acid-binding protein consists of a PIN domain and a Zn-ribbon module [Pyrenophora tritici-repentis]
MADPSPAQQKPIHSLILDTGPLIKNTVAISTLINTAEELYTTPAILSEIRDEATRSRVQTTLVPFLKIRNPSPASYDAVIAFSKKTGDHAVLSRQDLGILALAYEVHCERNGGDYGLRLVPKGEVKRRPEEVANEGVMEAEKEKEAVSSKSEPVVPAEQTAAVGRKSKTEANNKRRSRRRAAKANKSHDDAAEEVTGEASSEAPEMAESVDPDAEDDGWEQPTGKKVAKRVTVPKSTKFNFEPTTEVESEPIASQQQDDEPSPAVVDEEEGGEEEGGVAVTQEQVQDQIQEQVVAQVQDQIHEQIQDQIHEQLENKGQEQLESQVVEQAQEMVEEQVQEQVQEQLQEQAGEQSLIDQSASVEVPSAKIHIEQSAELSVEPEQQEQSQGNIADEATLEQDMADLSVSQHTAQQPTPPTTDDSDSDSDWITPENLSSHQAKDGAIQPHISTASNPQLDVATMTTDFAMQNVLLQMNLNLLSTNMSRIKTVNTKVLRCHACFLITKEMTRQFCPRCGQATLQRVSCSTNAKGEFRIHLAKNYQFNKRGDKYSIPKPIAGTANTKWTAGQGGGKGGWGRDLILTEDQKEYTKRVEVEKRSKARDLMDENYLPGILPGDRGRAGGRVKVGAGKNVNAKKRS